MTSMQTKGTKGGRTSNPYVFTEAGIYMLMTVLKGDLAVRQSKALIRLFKGMKDYLIESPAAIGQTELLRLSLQTAENTRKIKQMKEEMATKNDLEKFLVNFTDSHTPEAMRMRLYRYRSIVKESSIPFMESITETALSKCA